MDDKRIYTYLNAGDAIYACLLVHGAPVYVRFADEREVQRFEAKVGTNYDGLVHMMGQDDHYFKLRPSAVDAIFAGRTLSGD